MTPSTHSCSFKDAKIGDICDLYNPLTGRLHTVDGAFNITRLTKTLVIITRNKHEVRYRREDGRQVGFGWMDLHLVLRKDQSR